MKVFEVVDDVIYEVVYVDEDDNILTESAVRAFKRVGKTVVRKFRCIAGRKKGKIVATAGACAKRKNPRKVRLGRKIARSRKGARIRKGKITNKTAAHKLLVKLNKRFKK